MNYPQSDHARNLIAFLKNLMPNLIKPEGIYPLPFLVLTGRGVDCIMSYLPDRETYETFAKAIKHPETLAAVMCLDRFDDEHHTKLPDLLSCTLYEQPPPKQDFQRRRDQFRYGIIEYCHRPRVVRPIDWDNKFWTNELSNEICRFVPDEIIGEDGTILFGPDMKLVSARVQ